MATKHFACINASMFTNFSASTSFISSPSTDFLSFASVGLVFSPSVDLLMLVVQNMTKPFYIRKPVIGVDNTTVLIYTKKTLCIGRVVFSSWNNARQYILIIPNELQWLEVVEDIVYQQVLLTEKIGGE